MKSTWKIWYDFDSDDTYFDIDSGQTKSAYQLLPGLGVLVGGMWIANLYYWGFNQYIIQRALAAKDIKESQKWSPPPL